MGELQHEKRPWKSGRQQGDDMKSWRSLVPAIVVGLMTCGIAANANGQMSDRDKFKADSQSLYERLSALRLEGLQNIVQFEHSPTSDGWLIAYVDTLCALPPRREHYPLIIKLIQKPDPWLQEAGIKLATASVSKLNDYSGLEAPICELLRRPDLDPWVLEAIVGFAAASCNPRSPALSDFFADFAAVAYERSPAKTTLTGSICRQRGIQPYEDARRWVIQVMLNQSKPTPHSEAVLPYLERAFKTKGWAETYRAAGEHNVR